MKAPLSSHLLYRLAFFVTASVWAAAHAVAAPPLIDRTTLLSTPEVGNPQVSPDGQFLAFFKTIRGARGIWIKRTDEPLGKGRPLTEPLEVSPRWASQVFYWTSDSKHILFTQDGNGNGKSDLFVVDVMGPSPNAPVRNIGPYH